MTTTVLKIIISPKIPLFYAACFFYNMRRNKNMTKGAKIVRIPFLISYIRHFWWYRFMSKKWNDLDSSSLTWPGPKIFSCQLRIYFTNGRMIWRLRAFTIFFLLLLGASELFHRLPFMSGLTIPWSITSLILLTWQPSWPSCPRTWGAWECTLGRQAGTLWWRPS